MQKRLIVLLPLSILLFSGCVPKTKCVTVTCDKGFEQQAKAMYGDNSNTSTKGISDDGKVGYKEGVRYVDTEKLKVGTWYKR